MINEELKRLYISYLPELKKLYQELDSLSIEDKSVNDYVGPFLLSCWEDKYLSSKYRLLIFGQETNGWHNEYLYSESDIEDSIKCYKDFKLGENYGRIFWQYAHKINQMINGLDDLNFMWNNVNKFGDDGRGRPHSVVLDKEIEHFNVLSQELRILNPDICIFLSGPYYDEDLRKKLPDLKAEQFKDYPTNEVARYASKSLPYNSFRTYHPGYGNRYKKWYNDVLSEIVNSIKSNH